MSEVLQQLQFSVGSLRQDGCAERLHNLLHSDGLICELIFGRAYETECTHAHGLQVGVPIRRQPRSNCSVLDGPLPARDLKGRTENLRAHEFGHFDGVDGDLIRGKDGMDSRSVVLARIMRALFGGATGGGAETNNRGEMTKPDGAVAGATSRNLEGLARMDRRTDGLG